MPRSVNFKAMGTQLGNFCLKVSITSKLTKTIATDMFPTTTLHMLRVAYTGSGDLSLYTLHLTNKQLISTVIVTKIADLLFTIPTCFPTSASLQLLEPKKIEILTNIYTYVSYEAFSKCKFFFDYC